MEIDKKSLSLSLSRLKDKLEDSDSDSDSDTDFCTSKKQSIQKTMELFDEGDIRDACSLFWDTTYWSLVDAVVLRDNLENDDEKRDIYLTILYHCAKKLDEDDGHVRELVDNLGPYHIQYHIESKLDAKSFN